VSVVFHVIYPTLSETNNIRVFYGALGASLCREPRDNRVEAVRAISVHVVPVRVLIMEVVRSVVRLYVYVFRNRETDPEAGQYFHVPLALWSIKHEMNKCENHRNTSAIKLVLSHFRPVSHLRDIRFRLFFFWACEWATFYVYNRMTKQPRNWKNIGHGRNVLI